jgi:hypothetical protein
MTKVSVISAATLVLGIGYAWAVDENQAPTANPSSSGRPSAILSQNECQDLWTEALNQSDSGMSGSSSGASSTMTPGTSSGAASNQGSPSVAGSNDAGSASGASNMQKSGQSSSSSNLTTSGAGQGGLSKQQATRYIANFAMVDKNSDGNVSETEFQEGCQKGWVQAASSSGTGKSGSSSSKSGG